MIGAARLFWTGAIVAGGVYLYRKARNGQSELAAHAAGIVVGDRVGTIAGYALAGPGGALAGSVTGAIAGALAADKYWQEGKSPVLEPAPVRKMASRRRKTGSVELSN